MQVHHHFCILLQSAVKCLISGFSYSICRGQGSAAPSACLTSAGGQRQGPGHGAESSLSADDNNDNNKEQCGAGSPPPSPQPFPNVIPGLDVMSLSGELHAK